MADSDGCDWLYLAVSEAVQVSPLLLDGVQLELQTGDLRHQLQFLGLQGGPTQQLLRGRGGAVGQYGRVHVGFGPGRGAPYEGQQVSQSGYCSTTVAAETLHYDQTNAMIQEEEDRLRTFYLNSI